MASKSRSRKKVATKATTPAKPVDPDIQEVTTQQATHQAETKVGEAIDVLLTRGSVSAHEGAVNPPVEDEDLQEAIHEVVIPVTMDPYKDLETNLAPTLAYMPQDFSITTAEWAQWAECQRPVCRRDDRSDWVSRLSRDDRAHRDESTYSSVFYAMEREV